MPLLRNYIAISVKVPHLQLVLDDVFLIEEEENASV